MDLWFPPLDAPRSSHYLYYDVARMVCNVCPVREKCEMLGTEEEFGMWGGMTPLERTRRSSYTPPKRALTETQLQEMIPVHSSSPPLNIRPLRAAVMSLAQRAK